MWIQRDSDGLGSTSGETHLRSDLLGEPESIRFVRMPKKKDV
jgi:hypothetical protein